MLTSFAQYMKYNSQNITIFSSFIPTLSKKKLSQGSTPLLFGPTFPSLTWSILIILL